jgi:hypothetical protein
MQIRLLTCDATRPDKRAIIGLLQEIGEGVSDFDAQDYCDILLAGDPVEIAIADSNSSSALRGLRKLDIDYEMM